MVINKHQAVAWVDRVREKDLLESLGDGLSQTGWDEEIFPDSVQKSGDDVLVMGKIEGQSGLVVIGNNSSGFRGLSVQGGNIKVTVCPLNHTNAEKIRALLPYTAPVSLADKDVTIGVGDRLGIASAGHLRLFKGYSEEKCSPVLAQQSVRELNLTARDYKSVMDSATWAVFQEGYRRPWGADGDHLKTAGWVQKALRLGYTMITADVSDFIRDEWAAASEEGIAEGYEKAYSPGLRKEWEAMCLSYNLPIETGDSISFTASDLARIALVYGNALEYAEKLYRAGKRIKADFDFELSIDETSTPTLPAAHVFIALDMKRRGIEVSSLAPRFVGEFQKGIDYIGDEKEFDATFQVHALIAKHFGYRISIHSGSDKFMIFPLVGKHTDYKFHLKTAGTNWLQALVVIAETEPVFYRELHKKALETFPAASQYYHITPNLDNYPDASSLKDDELPGIFENPDARQILHVTYGEMLRDKDFRDRIYGVLYDHIDEYWRSLESHIGKHLDYLGIKKE